MEQSNYAYFNMAVVLDGAVIWEWFVHSTRNIIMYFPDQLKYQNQLILSLAKVLAFNARHEI